jgi:hypothetical protein
MIISCEKPMLWRHFCPLGDRPVPAPFCRDSSLDLSSTCRFVRRRRLLLRFEGKAVVWGQIPSLATCLDFETFPHERVCHGQASNACFAPKRHPSIASLAESLSGKARSTVPLTRPDDNHLLDGRAQAV